MWLNPQFTEDLVTFIEEILNGKLHFLQCFIHLKLALGWLRLRKDGMYMTTVK